MSLYLALLVLLQFEKKAILLCLAASIVFSGYALNEKNNLERIHKATEQREMYIFEGVAISESLIEDNQYYIKGYLTQVGQLVPSASDFTKLKPQKVTLKLKLPFKNPEKFTGILKSGMGVRIKGQLGLIKPSGNKGDFNYKYFLWGKGYQGVFEPSIIESLPSKDQLLEIMRMKIGRGWLKRIYEQTAFGQGPLAVGILLGEDGFLSEEIQEDYKLTGTTHILTVSGVHFGILMLWVHKLLSLKEMSYRKRKAIVLILMTGFLWIIGFDTAAMRAYWMVLMLGVMMRLYIQPDPLTALSLTAVLMLVLRPSQVLSVSFQMSMAAMFGLMVVYPIIMNALKKKWTCNNLTDDKLTYQKRLQKYIVEPIIASIAVNLVMMPFLIHYFNTWAWSSIVYNIPVAWISTVVIPLLALLGPLSFIEPLCIGVGIGIGGLLSSMTTVVSTAETFGILPFVLCSLKPWQIFAIVFVFLLFLLEKQNKWAHQMKQFHRGSICFLTFAGLIIAFYSPTNGYHEVVFMDVGQGDGAYIKQANGTTLLIDSGKKKKVGDVSGILLKSGVKHIDYWIVSHFHDDHMGSYETLMNQHEIGSIEAYNKGESKNAPLYIEFEKMAKSHHIPIETRYAGSHSPLVNISYLWPPKNYASKDLNDESLVAQVSLNSINILFTGDMTSRVEYDIMKKVSDRPLLLKMPHHGSKHSSTEAVYDVPNLVSAVCSVGKNRYGHPNEVVMKNYLANTPLVYRTDQSGSVTYLIKGNRVYYKTYY